MSVVIETTLGDLTVDLYLEDRPRACLNFLKLCKIKYYNFNLFHTISRGFIAQTGDPTGARKGGESIFGVIDGPSKRYFEAENEPRIKHTRPGLISFVGSEDKMIGSQFFLTLGEDLTYLDEKHCVFGEVVEGMDVLEAINEVICDKDDRPYKDVRITHTVLLDDPYPDPKRLKVPSRSPSPSAARLAGGRIAPDEEIDETSGRTNHEIAEMQAEREAKARATILEMVGDIPDAEMAPPENVLFVCKLNPVTTDDDLEIIFSRFGKIKSCEVIRDRKSGDSLQYAFIEFEEQKSCEEAYFKMGNVLIDERRIHVDFSQSVSKVKWLGKGRGVTHYDDNSGEVRSKKTTDADISVGNYKVQNGAKSEYHGRRERRRQSKSPRRQSRSPLNDSRGRQSASSRSRHSSRSPKGRKSQSRSPRRRRMSPSLNRNSRNMYSPRRNRKRSRSPTYRRRQDSSPQRIDRRPLYRKRSRSPRASSSKNYSSYSRREQESSSRKRSRSTTPPLYNKRPTSPKRERKRSRSLESYKRGNRSASPKGIENPRVNAKQSRKESKSPTTDKYQVLRKAEDGPLKSKRSASPLSSNVQGSSSLATKKDKSVSPARSSKDINKKIGNLLNKDKAHKEIPKQESQAKKPKASVSNKKQTGSSSSEDDSNSSSEDDKVKSKSRKRKHKKDIKMKKIKKTKKCKKKYSSSSDSSSSESASDASSDGESDGVTKSKKKKSKRKRTKSSSESR